jgi:hypothetical protein
MEITVPAEDLKHRGATIKSNSYSERIGALVSIERSIRKYFSSSEEIKCRDICLLCQDIVLLWHLEDPRVQLIME